MFGFLDFLKDYSLWSNTAYEYLMAFIIFVISIIVLKIFQVIILAKLRKLALKTKTDFDDMLIEMFSGVRPPFYILVSLYFALKSLFLSELVEMVIRVLFIVVIVFEVIQAAVKLFEYFLGKYLEKAQKESGKKILTISMVNTLKFFVKLILWSLGTLMILSNLGVNVTSIIAGLGVGGIAIALAAQGILADIFSSFSIYFDRPFEVGDFIQVGTEKGEVEKIGLKTSRLRTPQGEELIISNQELTSARVQNFKRMEKRRISFSLGLTYDTTAEKLEKIPKIIKAIVDKESMAEFDRCFFVTYGDSALVFDIVYYVESPDYIDYLEVNQTINLAIYKKFATEKIDFAYPTQTIVTKQG